MKTFLPILYFILRQTLSLLTVSWCQSLFKFLQIIFYVILYVAKFSHLLKIHFNLNTYLMKHINSFLVSVLFILCFAQLISKRLTQISIGVFCTTCYVSFFYHFLQFPFSFVHSYYTSLTFFEPQLKKN